MEQQMNAQSDTNSLFYQRHAASIRVWHWLTFVVVSFLILTVLFSSTVLDPRANIKVVQQELKEKGVSVSDEQAWGVSHAFEDKMWDLHKFLGIGLSFLLLARIVIEFLISEEEKLKNKLKYALQLTRQSGFDKKESRHYLTVKWSYVFFYVLLIFMSLTGIALAFGFEIGIPREVRHSIKEVHGFGQYLIYLFILFHLVGIVKTDRGKSKGLVSGMLHGNAEI